MNSECSWTWKLFLKSFSDGCKYIWIPFLLISVKIIEDNNLYWLAENENILYIIVRKVMYWKLQASMIVSCQIWNN